DPLLKQFYIDSRCTLLRPVVIVDYYREAYIHPIGNVRITLDTRLCTRLGTEHLFSKTMCPILVIDAPRTILEVKFDDVFPQYIRGLFPDTLRPRSSIGKFVLCRAQQMQHIGDLTN
ncbi:MAG TPA: VTC domain-containing protein, partial [Candidatus Methanomethylicus sp.]|nr:VTC domain-containing protein [Candidatus Methanomethylicus sp.]